MFRPGSEFDRPHRVREYYIPRSPASVRQRASLHTVFKSLGKSSRATPEGALKATAIPQPHRGAALCCGYLGLGVKPDNTSPLARTLSFRSPSHVHPLGGSSPPRETSCLRWRLGCAKYNPYSHKDRSACTHCQTRFIALQQTAIRVRRSYCAYLGR
jgi:hypothetical protein